MVQLLPPSIITLLINLCSEQLRLLIELLCTKRVFEQSRLQIKPFGKGEEDDTASRALTWVHMSLEGFRRWQ
jgi:hypothetical protein